MKPTHWHISYLFTASSLSLSLGLVGCGNSGTPHNMLPPLIDSGPTPDLRVHPPDASKDRAVVHDAKPIDKAKPPDAPRTIDAHPSLADAAKEAQDSAVSIDQMHLDQTPPDLAPDLQSLEPT